MFLFIPHECFTFPRHFTKCLINLAFFMYAIRRFNKYLIKFVNILLHINASELNERLLKLFDFVVKK